MPTTGLDGSVTVSRSLSRASDFITFFPGRGWGIEWPSLAGRRGRGCPGHPALAVTQQSRTGRGSTLCSPRRSARTCNPLWSTLSGRCRKESLNVTVTAPGANHSTRIPPPANRRAPGTPQLGSPPELSSRTLEFRRAGRESRLQGSRDARCVCVRGRDT